MLRGFHKLCDKGLWDETRHLLADRSENAQMAKETAAEPGGYGEWTALHIACKRDPPADVIRTLCELSPTPAETFDLYNKLPIHYAAEYGADVKVMRVLIECCPQCLSGIDSEGRTPLHLSFKYSIRDPATLIDPMRRYPYVEEVDLLLGEDAAVVWTTDENDYLPLHYAVSNIDNYKLDVLEKIINADINSVMAQTKSGMTPLHLAILKSTETSITIEITKLLLGISSDGKEWIDPEFEGTRMLSCTDMLPLHLACQNFEHVPFETLQLLLERCPTSAAAEALEGGYPLQILESHRVTIKNSDEMGIFNKKSDMLFAYHPNILPHRTDKDRLERFEKRIIKELSVKNSSLSEETKSIWTWMCMFPEGVDKEGFYADIAAGILDKVKDAGSAKTLACVMISKEGGEDMPLYQSASPTMSKVLSPYLRFVDRYELKDDEGMKSDSIMVVKAYDSNYDEEDDRSNVVITFYSNREEFWQEVDVHTKLQKTADLEGLCSPAVRMIQIFDTDRMGTSQETGDDMKFRRDITQFTDIYKNISGFPYAIVREQSGEPIDSISSYNSVDNKFGIQNKKHVKDIAESILCLHNNNYVLGGMKVGDFVQLNTNTIKLRNLKSIVEVDSKSDLHTNFYGCVSNDFRISNLPPEMITKLDAEGVEKYVSYWSRVSNDFNIANELTPEQVKDSDKLKTHLEEEGCTFEKFWARVQNNAALWKRIQPRQVGDYYYVVKCFRAGVDGGVHLPEKLPYALVPISTDLDIWFFGSLMFELMTGESLFHSNKCRNLVNDSDFEKLCDWCMADYSFSRRFNDITSPLGRHILRTMLTSTAHRSRNMEIILKHQFFCDEEDEASSTLCREIVQEEKEEARKYKIEQDMKLRQSTLDKRTEKLSLVSSETQLKFELSQWKVLKSAYDLSEVTFPTSCIVLPYELEKSSSGDLRTPARNIALAHKLGLTIADTLHYLSVVSDIKKNGSGNSFNHKIQNYVDKNRFSASTLEDTVVKICEGVLRKAKNATDVVEDIISDYLPSRNGAAVAHKLISDTLRDIVDLDICGKVVSNAEAVQKSITSLLHIIGEYPEKAAVSIMNDQMRQIIGVNFTENSFAQKENVQNALMTIVQQIAQNPLSVMEGLLESRICELIDLYTDMDECFVYLVDEYSGVPVASDNTLRLNFSSDIAKMLLPPTLLAMRVNFPIGTIPLLGITLDNLPQQWNKLTEFELPFVQRDAADEIQVLLTTLGVDNGTSILSLLEQFYMKNDPEEDFSGLMRLCSPNDLMMWVTKKSRQQAMEQARQGLEKLQERNAKEAREKIANATKNYSNIDTNNLWHGVGSSFPNPKSSHKNQQHLSSVRGKAVNQQKRGRNSKDCDMEQYIVQARNDIQQKLDKLKGWKPSQRTESSRSDGFSEKVSDDSYMTRGEDEIYTDVFDGKQGQYNRDIPQHNEDEDHNISDGTIVFKSSANPEPVEEPHMGNIDGPVSATSEASLVDENKEPDNANQLPMKHHNEVDMVGEGSGTIQIESMQSVKSDISGSYVKGQWSPVHSDDEEGNVWPIISPTEESHAKTEPSPDMMTSPKRVVLSRERMSSSDRNKFYPKPIGPSPKSRRPQSSQDINRLRPRSGKTIGQKKHPTPGIGSGRDDFSTRILRNKSSTTSLRMHTKKRTPYQGFESGDNDSYFRAPMSHFEKIRPEIDE